MKTLTALVLSLLLCSAIEALAQESGKVVGTVVDTSGGVLPGVSVDVTSANGGDARHAVTDAAGRYEFTLLPSSHYRLSFSVPSFATVRRDDVDVIAGRRTEINVTLQVAMNANVVVTGSHTFRNPADVDRPEETLVGVAQAASQGAVTAEQ